MRTFALVLSVTTSILHVWLIIRLYLIKRHREYPLLIAYNSLSIVTFIATVIVINHALLFFLTYWIAEVFLSVVALLVLLAVFKPVAEVTYMLHPRYRLLLPLALVAIVLFAVWEAAFHPLRHTPLGHAASGVYSFVLGILFLEALILGACLSQAFSKTISWGRYDFGILSGFGLSAIMKFAVFLARWNFGNRFEILFRYLLPSAALGAALIWVIAFSRSEPRITKQEPDPNQLQRLIDLLHEHTGFVKRILANPPWRRQPLTVDPH